jgi:alanine-glyoxylate transaminase/serine-glyoxylate transaminase/serine-pyruvate transaminase
MTMTLPYKLFIPGPVSVDDDVLDAMSQPVMRHYGPEWMDVYNETTALLKQVFQTQNDVFMVPGPGTAGLEMAMGSLLATGQKVIVCHNGFFGARLATVAESDGLNVARHRAIRRRFSRGFTPCPARASRCPGGGCTPRNDDDSDEPAARLAEEREAGRVSVTRLVAGRWTPVDAWSLDACVTAVNNA